jgi:integrase
MPTDRDRVLTLFLGWTGVRYGEAAGLRVDAIDTLRRRVRIAAAVAEVRGRVIVGTPKTHAARTITFPGFLAPILGEYLGTVPGTGSRSPIAWGDRSESRPGIGASSLRPPKTPGSCHPRSACTTSATPRPRSRSRPVPA